MGQRVVVAMSGGVDSSTAAALLHAAGHDVVGVTLRLYDASGTVASIGRCCGPRDIEDARATAATVGFPHYVLDEVEAFGRLVIDDFVSSHRQGRTPNPCVRCNQHLKFGPLVRFARAIGASGLATGHYARLETAADGPRLLRALDRDKDQSYFLFGVDPALLAVTRFPLGGMTKADVRAEGRRLGVPNADKPDSQQICFIPDGDHRGFVEARGGAGPTGVVIDEAGNTLGTHGGTHNFTVGQRRGVPAVGGGDRRFVVRIDAATGTVRVGLREALARRWLAVDEARWWPPAPPVGGAVTCAVQIRHRAAALSGQVLRGEDGTAEVVLDEPAYGVAAGQAAVFYVGDRVLGGGFMTDAAEADQELSRRTPLSGSASCDPRPAP